MSIPKTIDNIVYRVHPFNRQTIHKQSISVTGLDTETLVSGKCFMVCTSEGGVFGASDIPGFFFSRKYQNRKFVVYNLKFDEGSLLQHLPIEQLEELRKTDKTAWQGYKYKSIPRKMLRISRGKNSIAIYDIYGFFHTSLNTAAKDFLRKEKIDIETKEFTLEYVNNNWIKIAKYCIQDCILTKELADTLIKKFEGFGVFPQHLYSTAYISFQYFRTHTNIPVIKRIYDNHPGCLDFAMRAYSGGKFEVTEKGVDYYYEYDIVSAYPFEIANLIDIENAQVIFSRSYIKEAVYGFIYANINIPVNLFSPLAIKCGTINRFPVGSVTKYITKQEYEYMLFAGCDIKILDAYWLIVNRIVYPFREEIHKLVEYKKHMKENGQTLDYNIIKIFMNSLYGKFVQLIENNGKYLAGLNWNIIYGAVITANCRIRVSQEQQKYSSVIAVHTDSIISNKELPYTKNDTLGDFSYVVEGEGLILGSGIYQIGNVTKFRGFPTSISLIEHIQNCTDTLIITQRRPYSWREIVFHGWPIDLINQFVYISKKVDINFDKKRIWIKDWNNYKEIFDRKVYSMPYPYVDFLARK